MSAAMEQQDTAVANTWSLSPEQRACLDADGCAPTLSAEVAIDGALDAERLRRSLDAVMARHGILGDAFAQASGYRGLRRSRPARPARIALDLPAALDAVSPRIDPTRGETLSVALAPGGDRLRLTASALVADRGSLALILADLSDAYAADAALPADDEAVTYAQFAEWRDEVAADDPSGEARTYWGDHVGPDEAPLHLPYRRPGAAGPSAPPIGERRRVRPALADAFATALARPALQAAGAEAALQAAWWLLLARIADRTGFVAGWRHDCRRDYEAFAGLVGVFEKTLPLRVMIDPEASVAGLAGQIAERLDAHRGFQEHWPLDATGRADHRAVGFALGPVDRASETWSAAEIAGPVPFELCLEPTLDAAGRLSALALRASGDRYDAAALSVLLDQYETVLAALPDHAATAFAECCVVGAAERARLLAFGRPGPRALPATTLPSLVAGHAETTPDAPALSGGGVTLTCAGLEDKVAGLGAWLAALGVGPERIVALDMARSVDLVVAILAIWRAGGAYLTFDPSWPRARRDALTAFAGPILTLTDGDPGAGAHRFAEAMASLGDARLPDAGSRAMDRMALVLFTSGSTGAPKGVVIEHGQILAYTEAVIDALGLDRGRRFGLTSTVAADLGNTVLFAALRLGASLVVADDADMTEGRAFSAYLRDNAIDCAKLAPSHLAALIDAGADTLPEAMILGGEAARPALLDRIRALAPQTRIANHYGPTETCVGVLVHAVDPAETAPGDGLPLSRVLDGSEAYILDAQGGLTPTGACGILHIGGAQLCRGYLPGEGFSGKGLSGDSAEAAAPFVANPFGPGRLYPTGDRARHRPGGGLVLVGRADDQVKVRGFRVEPGEIEATLAGLDGVRQAAVRAWPSEEGGARIVAYVVVEAGRDAAALGAALAERLPAPMRPASILLLDALPRLANGKLDRAALPEAVSTGGAGVAPRTALEAVLADAMAELLDRPAGTIGATDDFFDAGGHSLLVIKLVARLRKLLHVEAPPGIVFDARSPQALADALGGYAASEALEEIAALRLELAGLSKAERAALLAPREEATE